MARIDIKTKTQMGRGNCTGEIKIKISAVMKTDSKLVVALKIFEKRKFAVKQERSMSVE